jgi:predicted regulator of Ras-like GTPase activity (Roadblock/LC7/MglB family)
MSTVSEVVKDLLQNVPGLVGVVAIDIDGIPIALEGDLGLPPEHIGAMLASIHKCCLALGDGLGQFYVESFMAEYDQLKFVQYMMPRGCLIVIATKSAPLGLVRLEAKRGIETLNQIMETTVEARERFMEAHKFRKPKTEEGGQAAPVSLLAYLQKKG